ncbi:hypothetical protein Cgig2_000747 [Carnegiea gigantea]|uniref:Beta-carotene isomerase D27-like C-terminal domain-containing protein n=1 Tax=Carnegiea gigantea TaxID=171969 RepID=A0A9Q1KDC9_9CARY|nr:hypothetical protein Cgig2_000747 [Carnegiea gigantea]
MQSLSHTHPFSLSLCPPLQLRTKSLSRTPRFRLSCSSSSPPKLEKEGELKPRTEYRPNWVDDFFLNSLRKNLAEEVGWDSEKSGYDGLIELANGLMVGRTNQQTSEAAVRILRSLFPPFVLELYKMLITPIAGGRFAAIMVYVERCKYLEESKCAGVCLNTCKLPSQVSTEQKCRVQLVNNFAIIHHRRSYVGDWGVHEHL